MNSETIQKKKRTNPASAKNLEKARIARKEKLLKQEQQIEEYQKQIKGKYDISSEDEISSSDDEIIMIKQPPKNARKKYAKKMNLPPPENIISIEKELAELRTAFKAMNDNKEKRIRNKQIRQIEKEQMQPPTREPPPTPLSSPVKHVDPLQEQMKIRILNF
eukprot:Lithocolla_globosa_v1_NODE_7655_length_917_cov_58.776102.p1 type:complete len:162 gc:universal NODE_7655_length_917_cov_58.776102:201-686(+)